MSAPSDQDLRTTLHRLADAGDPLPVADDLWQRGRAARRRGQALVVAAIVLALVSVGGTLALWSASDREARTASTTVPAGGAIPSRIEDIPSDLELTSDLAVGRASATFLSPSTGDPVVITATDGVSHRLDLPDPPTETALVAVSPDGWRLAWASLGRVHTLDLRDGTETFFHPDEQRAAISTLTWAPNAAQLFWTGTDVRGEPSSGLLPVTDATQVYDPSVVRGIPSPSGQVTAIASEGTGDAAPFLRRRGRPVSRALPSDLYPEGASVRPLGWATDHLVVAELDAPRGSYVEGRHLVLFTSPDLPESAWTFRVLARDVPQSDTGLSVAADLVPDLDGTSFQPLTHDFDIPIDQRVPGLIALPAAVAVTAAVGLLIGLLIGARLLWLRRRPG